MLPFVELGVAYHAIPHLSRGRWLGFSLWVRRQRILLGMFVCFFHCGSFVGFSLPQEHWVGIIWWDQVGKFIPIDFLWLLRKDCGWNLCLRSLWQTPGRNENLKEGALTDLEGRTHPLPNLFLEIRQPWLLLIFIVLKNWRKKHNSSVYCFAYWIKLSEILFNF